MSPNCKYVNAKHITDEYVKMLQTFVGDGVKTSESHTYFPHWVYVIACQTSRKMHLIGEFVLQRISEINAFKEFKNFTGSAYGVKPFIDSEIGMCGCVHLRNWLDVLGLLGPPLRGFSFRFSNEVLTKLGLLLGNIPRAILFNRGNWSNGSALAARSSWLGVV